jgi:hypothetical protein
MFRPDMICQGHKDKFSPTPETNIIHTNDLFLAKIAELLEKILEKLEKLERDNS